MKKQITLLAVVGLWAISSSFNVHAQFIPAGPEGSGLTYVVKDVKVWYNKNTLTGQPFAGYVTNGDVVLPDQVDVTTQANGNWEPCNWTTICQRGSNWITLAQITTGTARL